MLMEWTWLALFIPIYVLGQVCVLLFERWFARRYGDEALVEIGRMPIRKIPTYLSSKRAKVADRK